MNGHAGRLAAALSILALGSPALAAAPAEGKDIPLFPGSTRDAAAEKEEAASPAAGGGARWFRVYASTAAAEEVFRFYEKALGATPDDGSGEVAPPRGVRPTPVRYTVYLRGPEDLHPTVRGAIARDRKPLRDGMWLGEATLAWARRAADGAATRCSVRVWDQGAEGEGGYRRATRIEHACTAGERAPPR